jgi:hypothetical protein
MEPPIPGYHSKTAYSFLDSQASKIVDICAYRLRVPVLLDIFTPPQELTITGNLCGSTFRESTGILGALEVLPLEVIQHIILQLDLASLFRFRQVSYRARTIVDSLWQYQKMTSHALGAFCLLLRKQLATRVALLDFYRLFCEEECGFCSSFGNLVYFPTWTRCCSVCLSKRIKGLRMISVASAKRVLKLSRLSLDQLPQFRNQRASYTRYERRHERKIRIVPLSCSIAAYRQENSGSDPADELLEHLHSRHDWSVMSCCEIPSYNQRTGQLESAVSCSRCELALELNIGTGDAEKMRIHAGRNFVHTQVSFLEHFRWCQQAQALWTSSKDGTIVPVMLPNRCRRGGYHNPIE